MAAVLFACIFITLCLQHGLDPDAPSAMKTFRCYYCAADYSLFRDLIDHLVQSHPTKCLKYRELELSECTGAKGYRTKAYEHVVPSDGEVFVTTDNRVGLYKTEFARKKTKLNTPLKYDDDCNEHTSGDEAENVQESITELVSEMEIGSVINDANSSVESDKNDNVELLNCIPDVLENLRESGHLETYQKWCKLILEKKFPMNNIGFLLFLDIIDWYSSSCTSNMRYLRPQTRQFWEVGYKLFKGKFIRFMAGPKGSGQIVDGSEETGCCQASRSKLNFAVPSLQTLSQTKVDPIFPGVFEETISTLSETLKGKPVKIGADGKKIARGKGKRMGDVDCWGYESKPSLNDNLERFECEKRDIKELINVVTKFDESGQEKIPVTSFFDIQRKLVTIILIISNRIRDLRTILVRLTLGIEKFMRLGDQVSKQWTKSKYVPVISSLKVSKYDVEQATENALRSINDLCDVCARLNGEHHNYCYGGTVDLSRHSNYHQLKCSIDSDNTRFIKQRSAEWFKLRASAKVTGSTCGTAVGLGKLKDQQAHFDKVIHGKENLQQFSMAQQANMAYGTKHEIDGIATVLARVLPSMYPNLEFVEEGCVNVPNEDIDTFMVVSPDGSIRDSVEGAVIYMLENKCKAKTAYSTPVHYEIPKYYIPQLLCEMYAYGCQKLLFTSWSVESTTVFEVFFDDKLWKCMWDELHKTYGGQNPKRPSKFSDAKPVLQNLINDFQRSNVRFIGEFPSCCVLREPEEIECDNTEAHTNYSDPNRRDSYQVQCDSILKHLHGLQKWHEDAYRLCRTSATEILLFMANDLDRMYHSEMNNAHPIAYALKGSSLTNETFGKMMRHVIEECEARGLRVIATSSDGQWHKFGVRSQVNKPLTVLQLQRDVWQEQRKRSKADILKELRSCCKVTSLSEVKLSKQPNGCIIVYGHVKDEPLRIFAGSKITFHKEHCRESTDLAVGESTQDSTIESVELVENFGRGVVLDQSFYSDATSYDMTPLNKAFAVPVPETIWSTESYSFMDSLFDETNSDNTVGQHCVTTDIHETPDEYADKDEYVAGMTTSGIPEVHTAVHGDSFEASVSYERSGEVVGVGQSEYTGRLSLVNDTSSESTCIDVISSTFTESECTSTVLGFAMSTVFDSSLSVHETESWTSSMCLESNSSTNLEFAQTSQSSVADTIHGQSDYISDISEAVATPLLPSGPSNVTPSICISRILDKLQQTNAPRCHLWQATSVYELENILMDQERSCKFLQKREIILCIDELIAYHGKLVKFYPSWGKARLCEALGVALGTRDVDVTDTARKRRRYNPKPLNKIVSLLLNKIPKEALAVAVSQSTWGGVYADWNDQSTVLNDALLDSCSHPRWFSIPEEYTDSVRFHYDDCCHILTCLRSKICTSGIAGLRKEAWERAAESTRTQLNIAIVVECVDKQSVSFAKRLFAEDVQQFMSEYGYEPEATFVSLVRRWFEAEDNPGLSACERCSRRLALREWLLEGVNFGHFPPLTQYVKGIPIITYEALLVHIERKLQIYNFLPHRKYNPRSLGTQEVEQFFSTMRDLDPSGQGTPKPDDIPNIMATAVFLDNTRMDPDRPYFMQTTRAPVYPDNRMETEYSENIVGDTDNIVCDHFFDTSRRDRRKKKRKSGTISSPSQPSHGQTGVRQYHKCDESKILAHHRKGLPKL